MGTEDREDTVGWLSGVWFIGEGPLQTIGEGLGFRDTQLVGDLREY